jgi:hypothetical protein
MAFACSHIPYPLGIGLPCGGLSRRDRPPWGLPCSTSWNLSHLRVTLSPGGPLSCRWADYRTTHPAHAPFWFGPLSRFGPFDFTRFIGVHHVTHSALPLAQRPGAAPRREYFSARFAPPRYQGRTVQMRIGGQDHLGHTGHSMLVTFTSHLEAVSSRPWLGYARELSESRQAGCPYSRGAPRRAGSTN